MISPFIQWPSIMTTNASTLLRLPWQQNMVTNYPNLPTIYHLIALSLIGKTIYCIMLSNLKTWYEVRDHNFKPYGFFFLFHLTDLSNTLHQQGRPRHLWNDEYILLSWVGVPCTRKQILIKKWLSSKLVRTFFQRMHPQWKLCHDKVTSDTDYMESTSSYTQKFIIKVCS